MLTYTLASFDKVSINYLLKLKDESQFIYKCWFFRLRRKNDISKVLPGALNIYILILVLIGSGQGPVLNNRERVAF